MSPARAAIKATPVRPPGGSRLAGARLVLALIFLGCGGPGPEVPAYLPNDSPASLVHNLSEAWRRRDGAAYEDLLADDFRFYPPSSLLSSWIRQRDVDCTTMLLASPEVTEVELTLEPGPPVPVNEIGREGWVEVVVRVTHLAVHVAPGPGETEGSILHTSDQVQRFLFRRGRSEGDSLNTSETSRRFYLVEWRDRGGGCRRMTMSGVKRYICGQGFR